MKIHRPLLISILALLLAGCALFGAGARPAAAPVVSTADLVARLERAAATADWLAEYQALNANEAAYYRGQAVAYRNVAYWVAHPASNQPESAAPAVAP